MSGSKKRATVDTKKIAPPPRSAFQDSSGAWQTGTDLHLKPSNGYDDRMSRILLLAFLLIAAAPVAHGAEIITNEVTLHDAPSWLKRTRVQKVIDHIQMHLEWSIRRINVFYHASEAAFAKAQNLGPLAVAVTKNDGHVAVVHLGPKVTNANFDEVFGHELVHVIVFQKYKNAIPKWLEEGLANHLSSAKKVDYKWLAKQAFPDDVRHLAHPFDGTIDRIEYSYKASQAFAEMLDKKCDLQNLIRLSVERKLEDYLTTYCEIPDLNAAFRAWVKTQAAR